MPELVVTEEAVLAKIARCNCRRGDETPLSIEFATPDGVTFFVPKAPDGIGYTADQLNFIENTLAYYGLDLLPLDGPGH